VSHHRESVTALGAPAAVGPYVHAVRSQGLLFCSGQIGLHPETGEIVGTTTAEQAGRCLENLQAVCAAAGATLADAVKVGVFLRDMADYAEVNEVYASFFEHEPPARVAVAVVGLPGNALVEMDAIVALPD
jgi:2-iminobutanoate/2-iminopropanoate deaminase